MRDGEQVVRLGAGDYVGELALIDGGTRSATVTAESDLLVHGLTAWDFRGIVESDARIAWALTQELARRLREAQLDD